MKKIETNSIISYLENNGIKFTINNESILSKEYIIASIFSPIDNGFYFLSSNDFSIQSKNSLILTNQNLQTENSFIKVDNSDPQLLFYKILNQFFKQNSTGIISSSSIINSKAQIGKNVQIDSFCEIGECEIGDNVIIGSHTKIYDNVIIEENTVIESASVIGCSGIAWAWDQETEEKVRQPQLGGVFIGRNCMLATNTIVVRGSLNENTEIGENTYLAPGCRLGHGTIIGKFVHFANAIVTGGNTVIGNYSFVGSGVIFRPKIKIDESTVIGAGSVVVKNTTKAGLTLMGVPAKEFETKSNLSGVPKPKKQL